MEPKVRRGIGLVAHDAMKKDLIEWVLWNSELLMFSLSDVTIGVNFHWERKETQTFLGICRLWWFFQAIML